MTKELAIKSNAFQHDGSIPVKYTGWGDDISPELTITNISSSAKSIAIIMDDLSHPISLMFGRPYNHWLFWNIPVQDIIPENISHGEYVEELENAVQGIGYGKHRYRGPKPPKFLRGAHRYRYHVYILDCILELDPTSKKSELVDAMKSHILQEGYIDGLYQNGK